MFLHTKLRGGVLTRSFMRSVYYFAFFLFHATCTLSQDFDQNSKRAAVKAFMSSRTLRHDVAARKLMTARLEKKYVQDKRLSIRVRSGRIATFNFDTSSFLRLSCGGFQVTVESIWVDLNNQVSSTVHEQIRFLVIEDVKLADDIKWLKSVPRRPVLPFNVVSEKQGKFAMRIGKKFMRYLVDRNIQKATDLLTQEFQVQFESQEKMKAFLLGSENPAYVGFEVTSLIQTEERQMTMGTAIYLARPGEMGYQKLNASLTLRRGTFEWIVDDLEFEET